MLACWPDLSANDLLQRVLSMLTRPLGFLNRSLLSQVLLAVIFLISSALSWEEISGQSASVAEPQIAN